MTATTWRTERAKLANATLNNRPEVAQEARRNMTAIRLEEHIAATLAAAPPLSDEQRSRLAALFAPTFTKGGDGQ